MHINFKKLILNSLLLNALSISCDYNYTINDLCMGIKSNNIALAQAALQLNINKNYLQKNSSYFINLAINEHSHESLTFLMEFGLEIEDTDNYIQHPLQLSLSTKNTYATNLLINTIINFNHVSVNKETFLHLTIFNHQNNFIQYFIEKTNDINSTTTEGLTPLHVAAYVNNYKGAELLVKNHADINMKNNDGDTALHLAIKSHSYEIIDLLIQSQANVNLKNNIGQSAFDLLIEMDTEYIIQHLTIMKLYNNVNNKLELQLHTSTLNRDIKLINYLIAAQTNLDFQNTNNNNSTALHIACKENYNEISKIFINAHADINIQDINGETPLHIATNENNEEVVKCLIGSKAQLNMINRKHNSPLDNARLHDSHRVRRILLDANAQKGPRNY